MLFKQNYTLFMAFKMAYSCCFSLSGNVNFLDFFQKCDENRLEIRIQMEQNGKKVF